MKKISLLLLLFVAATGFAQQTYYWVGGTTGAWSAAASWNTIRGGGGTTRTTPNVGDILIFDARNIGTGNSASTLPPVTPSDLTEETISSLILTSNDTYSKPLTLTLPSGPKTLTVTNDLLMSYYTMLNDGGNTIKVCGNVINGIFNGLSTSNSFTYNFHSGTGKIELTGTNSSTQSVLYATRTNNGSGYTSVPTVIVGTPWTANTTYTTGQQVFYGPTSSGTNGASLFTVVNGGITGSTAPTTKLGGADFTDGTATLRWVGFAAKATCGITGGALSSLTITCPGSGYTSAPGISFSGGGGSGATATATISPNCYFLLQAGNVQIDAGANYNLCFSGNTTVNGLLNIQSAATLNFNTRTLVLSSTASLIQTGTMNIGTGTLTDLRTNTALQAVSDLEMNVNTGNNEFIINYNNKNAESTTIRIFNSTGQMLKTIHSGIQTNGKVIIATTNLPGGIYFVEAQIGTTRIVRKIMK